MKNADQNSEKKYTNVFEEAYHLAKLAFGRNPLGISKPDVIIEGKYKTNTEYTKSLVANSIKEIKDVVKEMYLFGKIAFSKNIISNLEKEKSRRLETLAE